jgi:hypothetical protein
MGAVVATSDDPWLEDWDTIVVKKVGSQCVYNDGFNNDVFNNNIMLYVQCAKFKMP